MYKRQEQSAASWFKQRDIRLEETGIDSACDLQAAPIFPVVEQADLSADFVQWLCGMPQSSPDTSANSLENDDHKDRWLNQRRMSAREIAQSVNLNRVYAQRDAYRMAVLPVMAEHAKKSVFYKLNLTDTAGTFAKSDAPVPAECDPDDDVMLAVHNRMFRSEVLKHRGDDAVSYTHLTLPTILRV